MPDKRIKFKPLLAPQARIDLNELLDWTLENFGHEAAWRYEALILQAIRDIAANENPPGSRDRSELRVGLRTYSLSLSRDNVSASVGKVRSPRHFLMYRRHEEERRIEILRILHEDRDMTFHLPRD